MPAVATAATKSQQPAKRRVSDAAPTTRGPGRPPLPPPLAPRAAAATAAPQVVVGHHHDHDDDDAAATTTTTTASPLDETTTTTTATTTTSGRQGSAVNGGGGGTLTSDQLLLVLQCPDLKPHTAAGYARQIRNAAKRIGKSVNVLLAKLPPRETVHRIAGTSADDAARLAVACLAVLKRLRPIVVPADIVTHDSIATATRRWRAVLAEARGGGGGATTSSAASDAASDDDSDDKNNRAAAIAAAYVRAVSAPECDPDTRAFMFLIAKFANVPMSTWRHAGEGVLLPDGRSINAGGVVAQLAPSEAAFLQACQRRAIAAEAPARLLGGACAATDTAAFTKRARSAVRRALEAAGVPRGALTMTTLTELRNVGAESLARVSAALLLPDTATARRHHHHHHHQTTTTAGPP